MIRLSFFYRFTNPVFFSIENVFAGIRGMIQEKYPDEFRISEVKLPFPSNPTNIRRNTRYARDHQTTINHITGDAHYIISGWSRKNVNILTIHDCVALHRFSRLDPRYWILKWIWYNRPVAKADAVTVISTNTKNELLRITKVDPRKITVIPNFVDPRFLAAESRFNSAHPRILFIGTTPNKNFERLVKALHGIPAILDIVGELSEEQLAEIRSTDVRFELSSRLSPEELRRKYERCDLLAFPTTYEGFGLPIVEAQAVGRPVLTSDLPPMNEVAGDGACLVDPYDIDSIRAGVKKIIAEDGYRNMIIQKGSVNVKRFNLEGVTDQYVALYRTQLKEKGILN